VLGLTYPHAYVTAWWVLMAVGIALVFMSGPMLAPKAQKAA